MADSVRHYMPKLETMKKYHAEIERILYSAETYCDDSRGDIDCDCCPFALEDHLCALELIRDAIGDTIEQHDTNGKGCVK